MIKRELTNSIVNCIKQFSDVEPQIYFRQGSDNVMIIFKGQIPSEEEASQIKTALEQFGTPVSNCCRQASFVSFLLQR